MLELHTHTMLVPVIFSVSVPGIMRNLKMVFPPKLSVQQYRPKNTDITPCKAGEFNFFSQLTTRSPELIQEFPLGHSQRHIFSGDGNLIEPEYIPNTRLKKKQRKMI